jgi:hypothetical protein
LKGLDQEKNTPLSGFTLLAETVSATPNHADAHEYEHASDFSLTWLQNWSAPVIHRDQGECLHLAPAHGSYKAPENHRYQTGVH